MIFPAATSFAFFAYFALQETTLGEEMAFHSSPTILERALQALQEYERTRDQAGPSSVLPFDQLTCERSELSEKRSDPLTVCPVHPAATWWKRRDGGAACSPCHPDPFVVAARESARCGPPIMPDGVALLSWSPKRPPVALRTHSVVNDTSKFIESTLSQLAAALQGRCYAAGHWSVRDLCERLEQAGVRVEVAKEGQQ